MCRRPSARSRAWRPPLKLNETTGIYFKRLAEISTPEQAKRYRDVFSFDPKVQAETFEYLREHEPRHASMLTSSLSPTMIQAGYRVNVIPSEAKATIDVRLLPGEDADKFLEAVRSLVSDPSIDVRYGSRASRPATEPSRTDDRGLHDDRGGGQTPLQRADTADDGHRRHGHGLPAR